MQLRAASFLYGKACLRLLLFLQRMPFVLLQGSQLLLQIANLLLSVILLLLQCLQMHRKLMQSAFRMLLFAQKLCLSGKKLLLHGLPLGDFPLRLGANPNLLKNFILKGLHLRFILTQHSAQGCIFFLQGIQFLLSCVHFQLQSCHFAAAKLLLRFIFRLLFRLFRHFSGNTAAVCLVIGTLLLAQANLALCLFQFRAQLCHFAILLLQKGIQFLIFLSEGSCLRLFPVAFGKALCKLLRRSLLRLQKHFRFFCNPRRIPAKGSHFRLLQPLLQTKVFPRLLALLLQRLHLHL